MKFYMKQNIIIDFIIKSGRILYPIVIYTNSIIISLSILGFCISIHKRLFACKHFAHFMIIRTVFTIKYTNRNAVTELHSPFHSIGFISRIVIILQMIHSFSIPAKGIHLIKAYTVLKYVYKCISLIVNSLLHHGYKMFLDHPQKDLATKPAPAN